MSIYIWHLKMKAYKPYWTVLGKHYDESRKLSAIQTKNYKILSQNSDYVCESYGS